ncbi:hypothetical protein LEQ06_10960 [Paraclostridium sp. AKS46]|nr:hypothetical protein [Paraclostridium sp. AKS46]
MTDPNLIYPGQKIRIN